MDVLALRHFYAGPLGGQVRRLVAARLASMPLPPAGARVLGLGFAVPWLEIYQRRGCEVMAFMPAHQGAMRWPDDETPATALVDEAALPLADGSMDLALVAHALELTPARKTMLAELWRVLAPSGHAVFIVPNRAGLWARAESTPFGHGRPFSRRQLEQLLLDASFTPQQWEHALFMPPWRARLLRAAPGTWERAGRALFAGFSGLILADAVKQVHALRRERKPALLIPAWRPAPAGLAPAPRAPAARRRA